VNRHKLLKIFFCTLALFIFALSTALLAYAAPADNQQDSAAEAAESTQDNSTSAKAIAAAICVSLGALGGTLGMGIAIAKSSESIARQPESEGKIRTNLMLGLIFIETAIIYALVIAIMIIFVL